MTALIEAPISDLMFEVLASELISPGRSELTPVMAVTDVLGWVNDSRTFDRKHRRAWKSAMQDALGATSLLGPALRAVLDKYLADFEQSCRTLEAITNKGSTATGRNTARVASETLLQELRSGASSTAAWDDLVQAAQDPSVDLDDLSWRTKALAEIVGASGVDFGAFATSARGILRDSALEAAFAESYLNGSKRPPRSFPSPGDDAGMTDDERLDLCRRLLEAPAVGGHQVVWLSFEAASLEQNQMEVGPVTFFHGGWLLAAWAHPDGPAYPSLPKELTALGESPPEELQALENFVVARVDLGNREQFGSLEAARQLVTAMVAVVRDRSSGHWRLMRGHMHAIDGSLHGWSGFSAASSTRHYAPWLDPTGAQLGGLAETLASALPAEPGSRLGQVLDAVTWHGDAYERGDAFVDVVLAVRVLELVASWLPGSVRWQAMAEDAYSVWWSRQQVIHEAYYAIHDALSDTAVAWLAPEGERGRLRELGAQLITHDGARSLTDIERAIPLLPYLDTIYRRTCSEARRIRLAAATMASGNAAAARIDVHKERFNMLLKRLERCRNAVAHGGPLSVETALTTVEFGQTLARISLQRALKGELTGEGIENALNDLRTRADQVVASLRAGGQPVPVLFAA